MKSPSPDTHSRNQKIRAEFKTLTKQCGHIEAVQMLSGTYFLSRETIRGIVRVDPLEVKKRLKYLANLEKRFKALEDPNSTWTTVLADYPANPEKILVNSFNYDPEDPPKLVKNAKTEDVFIVHKITGPESPWLYVKLALGHTDKWKQKYGKPGKKDDPILVLG